MVADIARTTYDPSRQYRLLIAQQGRVTLEADNNEASAIAVESLRLETIDIVGPAGTPNDGYRVSASGNTVTVGTGTYYLGGWRLTLDTPVDIARQPDWLDANPGALRPGDQLIALLITEQSVCAAEDQALREVALGGPDSAARARLMQHFLRIPIEADNCAVAATQIANLVSEDGLTIDPATCALVSAARLQAGFVPGPPNNDPCAPAAAGGYLGADNQMVRVTVIAYDASTRSGTLLWGWNNASLLYRVSMTDPVTLTLINVPVDEEHAPQQGQMAEILRTEAELGDGNVIADHEGFVTSIAQAYSFDTGEIVLTDPLPAAFQSDKNPLFVRLWQAAVPFDAGKATPLDTSSGITVAITLPILPTHIAARPFWHFAVRPATPQNIYPQRYFDAPQPPDGPRQWITDLAVIASTGKTVTVVDDCRVQFPGHGGGGTCCGLVLGPDEVASRGGLQSVITSLAGNPAVLSLKSGTYLLERPLLLNSRNAGLTIEGCSEGVVIEGDSKNLAAFGAGLVRMNGATGITLRKLEFVARPLPPANNQSGLTAIAGVTLIAAQNILIEDCQFTLATRATTVFGGAVLVLGATQGVGLRGNRFAGQARDSLLCGVMALTTTKNVATALDDWEISDNSFQGFFAAVLAYAHLGLIRCLDNIVTNCGSGFIFVEANIGAANAFATAATAAQNAQLATAAAAVMRRDILANIVRQGALFDSLATVAPPTVSEQATAVLAADMQTRGNDALASLDGTKSVSRSAAKTKAAIKTTAEAVPQPPPPAPTTSSAADPLDGTSIVAEAFQRQLIPALRITDNEITLNSVQTWIGIAVLESPSDAMTTLVINGNRVSTPDVNSIACGVLFPGAASISGNMLLQLGTFEKSAKGALIAISQTGILQIGANVVRFEEWIFPARTPPATTSWDFLNTVAS